MTGIVDERIDQAIENTRAFFEILGVKIRLSEYGVPPASVDEGIKRLQAHGVTELGEHQTLR